MAMTALFCRRSTCWTCLSCWKCVESGLALVTLMAGVGWPCCLARPSLIDGHRPKLPRSLAAPPAHSPPTQPVARTTFGMGDDLKSGCGAQELQEVVQLIFVFYTEIIRVKIP